MTNVNHTLQIMLANIILNLFQDLLLRLKDNAE
jgi:hypothetical protein